MATEIDKFIFSLALDSSQFKKGEKDTLAAIKNIRNAFTSTYQLIGGVKLLGGVIQDFKNLNLQLDQLARRTGESAAALDKWGRAAERLGLNRNSVLNDIDRISQVFNNKYERPGLLAKLSQLGVNAGDAAGSKSVSELLFKIAEGSKNRFNSPQERAAMLQSVLGLSPDMANMMLRSPNLAGFVNSMSSTITPGSIRQAEELQKVISELQNSFTDLSSTLTVKLAPAITDLLNAINKTIKGIAPVAGEEEKEKRLAVWEKALGVKGMTKASKAEAPKFDPLHPFKSTQAQMDYMLTPAEQAIMDATISAGMGGFASTSAKFRSSISQTKPGYGFPFNTRLFQSFERLLPGSSGPGTVLTRREYDAFVKSQQNAINGARNILGGLYHPEYESKILSYEEMAKKLGRITEENYLALNPGLRHPSPVDDLLLRGSSGLISKIEADRFFGRYVNEGGHPNYINIGSPQYSININAADGSPEAIGAAVKQGVQDANSSLAGTLYKNMNDMSYQGSGLERFSPPVNK